MIMEFEENFLDLIVSECTGETLFDEYVNYEQIVSESLVLSESQEIKLKLLREFSIKDIGKRIADAFKAVKTFVSNLIFKLGVFIKNIGKDEIFKNVGKAINELSPEERKQEIKYTTYKFTLNINNDWLKENEKVIKETIKLIKTKDLEDIEADYLEKIGIKSADDLKLITSNMNPTASKKQLGFNTEFKDTTGTKIEAYKNYVSTSKELDKMQKYVEKIAKQVSDQADKLEKVADGIGKTNAEDPSRYSNAIKIIRTMLLPATKANASVIKLLAQDVANKNKEILTKAIGLIKGDKLKKDAEELKGEKFDANSTNESYTPWNDLD